NTIQLAPKTSQIDSGLLLKGILLRQLQLARTLRDLQARTPTPPPAPGPAPAPAPPPAPAPAPARPVVRPAAPAALSVQRTALSVALEKFKGKEDSPRAARAVNAIVAQVINGRGALLSAADASAAKDWIAKQRASVAAGQGIVVGGAHAGDIRIP